MPEIACIDTNILIWAVQGAAHSSQTEMVPRSRALIAALQKEKARVIIPSVALGEFLIGLPPNELPRYEVLVRQKFPIIPYDIAASIVFARLWRAKADQNIIAQVKAENAPPTRVHLRADFMIIATAIAAGATCIYGHEPRFRRYTDGFIRFENIADLNLQGDIFYADVKNSPSFTQADSV